VQTISNPDGTVSIVHVDPNNPVITLPDGTQAQVRLDGAHKCKISFLKIAMFRGRCFGSEIKVTDLKRHVSK
jgi:hypothetical protein